MMSDDTSPRGHFDPEWKNRVSEKASANTQAQTESLQKERERVKAAFLEVASTEAGKTVFRTLMNELGFKESTIVGSSILNTNDLIFNESRRRVWIQIRKFIPATLRNVIEQDREKE